MSNYFDLQNAPVLSTPSSITVPKISTIGYPGDDTAADPAGGQTITLTGAGFEAGASVIINGNAVGVVSVVSSTTITFTSPAQSAGSYVLYVVNTDGGTAIAVPGIQYSGTPNWTTAAGSLGSYTETVAIANTVTATGDAPITYSVFSGSLPTGATLNSANGYISGTSPLAASPTTYTFTIRATDAEQQDTNRSFSLTINPDVVTWSSPANGTTYTSVANSAISNVALSASAASGQNITYTANALPTGLSISGSNITGTPTVVANSSTLLTATAATTNAAATRTINWVISVASDIYFPYVTTLLSANTPASTFVTDISTNNFAVTVNGDTRPNNFGPYTPGYYSAYFDGTGDYLTVPDNAAFEMAADFTVEAWFYGTVWSTWSDVVTKGAAGIYQPYYIAVNNGTLLFYSSSDGSSWNVANGVSLGAVSLNQWYHVAVSRQGTSLRLFLNGSLITTITNGSALYDNDRAVAIGGRSDGTELFTGYISNVRIVKGTAVYTAAFTPSTTPLTAIANTSLLTCQSNRFIDNSTNNFTITRNGDTLVSGFDPFVPSSSYTGYGSGYFDGTGDYLSFPASSAMAMGTGDYTIEFWLYLVGTGDFCVIDNQGAGGNMQISRISGTLYHGGTTWTYTFANNVWTHIAFSRSGTNLRLFANGALQQTQTNSNSVGSAANTNTIGVRNDNFYYLNGYLSNIRVVKGTAVYTTAFTPPATPLTAVANTSLLTLQNNQPNNNSMFLDSSTSNFNITRNGNTTQGSFSPYGGGWSNYFDGNGDWLSAPNINFSTNNFTIEGWFYYTGATIGSGTNTNLWGMSNGAGANPKLMAFLSTTNIYLFDNSEIINVAHGMVPNTWYHLAFVRTGTSANQCFIYRNGVALNSTSLALGTQSSVTGVFNVGYVGESYGTTFTGYISNFRVVVGTALYTTTFTPPAEPLTPIANTRLLTCADNRFIDDSLNNFAITRNGDVSVQRFNPFNPVITTPTSYGAYFDGTGDYITAPNNAAFAFGTGDFTIECWLYYIIGGSADRFIVDSGNGANFLLRYGAGTTLQFYATGSLKLSYAVALQNSWNHIAIVRSGTAYTLYVNGTSVATGTGSENISNSTAIGIGAINTGASDYYSGYISNLRIVKGTAVYTSAFTPSTIPLTAIANTSLLTLQSPTFIDNSTNNFTITNNGDTAPRQFNPFGWTSTTGSGAAYTPALYGGSAYFDGTGDYLTAGSSVSLSSNFTVECWVYGVSYGSNGFFLYGLGNDINSSGATFFISTSGYLRIFTNNANLLSGTSATLTLNTWNHVAFVRSSGTVRAYLNGVQVDSASWSGTITGLSHINAELNGSPTATTYVGGACYISNHRVVTSAVYTSNFTPPVAPLTALQNTVLLNNMTGAGIYDSSMMANYETVGNASINTALKKYGNTSMYFDGTGDYLPAQTSPNFAFGTGDFTVEAWVYTADVSFSAQRGFIQTSATVGGLSTSYTSGIIILFGGSSAGSVNANVGGSNYNSGAGAVATNTWYHVALTRASGVVNLWLNGVSVSSGSGNTANLTGQNLVVGGYYSTGYLYNGYLDDVRITRGLARYTSTFTPTTTPFYTN